MEKSKPKHFSYILMPSLIIPLQSFLFSPKKSSRSNRLFKSPRLYRSLLFFLIVVGFFLIGSKLDPIRTFYSTFEESSSTSAAAVLTLLSSLSSLTSEEEEEGVWKQPEGYGYRPCLRFSAEYEKGSEIIKKDWGKYLMVVVSGGMNQQRNG